MFIEKDVSCTLAAPFQLFLIGATLFAPLCFFSTFSSAADTLPYSTRTRNYDGMRSTVHGDIRTVGMSGANVGLADTFIAALDNPAGLALTLPGADAKFGANWAVDHIYQSSQTPLYSFNAGMAWQTYPWGFSLGFLSPSTEGQDYTQGVTRVTTREFRFALARTLFSNRLSLGLAAVIGQSEKIIDTRGHASYAFGAVGGLQFQLPQRFIVGISGALPMRYGGAASEFSGSIAGFFQPIVVPARVSLGLGWIPNRYFRTDISFVTFGPSDGASLLRDENSSFTQAWSAQPRFGISYQWIDYAEFRSTFYAGTSLEAPRILGSPLRPHVSGGIEAVPWVIILAAGIDAAPGYLNYMAGVGVDILRLFSKLDLVPPIYRAPIGGFLPRPFLLSDVGLARPLVANWKPTGPAIDPIQAGLDLPGKVGEKAKQVGTDFVNTVRGDVTPQEPESASKKTKGKTNTSPTPSKKSKSL